MNVREIVLSILSTPEKTTFSFDMVLPPTDQQIVLRKKQQQMKIGKLWQALIGAQQGYTNLGERHASGLDVLSTTKKVIIEIKNRTTTDNASARRANLDKLVAYKKQHPDYECVYAMINDETEQKTRRGKDMYIVHGHTKIRVMVGMPFLRFIFGQNARKIVQEVRDCVHQYYS